MVKFKKIIIHILEYSILIGVSFISIIPLVSCLIVAFKSRDELYSGNILSLPENWLNFSNFETAFQDGDMIQAFIISFIIVFYCDYYFYLNGCDDCLRFKSILFSR